MDEERSRGERKARGEKGNVDAANPNNELMVDVGGVKKDGDDGDDGDDGEVDADADANDDDEDEQAEAAEEETEEASALASSECCASEA